MVISNTSWSLVNFRSGLIEALKADGAKVIAVAPPDNYSKQLEVLGCQYFPLEMDARGTSALRDLRLLRRLFGLMRRARPNAVLGFTIKPNIYGSLAARMLGIPTINTIPGLGTAFDRGNWFGPAARRLYKTALAASSKVYFQNGEDRDQFVSDRLVSADRTGVVPGSGVDLKRFQALGPAGGLIERPPVFLFVGRLLRQKGVKEFVDAARIVQYGETDARFRLLGFLDPTDPAYIDRKTLDGWVSEGVIDYLGEAEDVRPHLTAADVVVLPSWYREGTPRSLLEAAAMGKPIITTDTRGCRNTVEDGVTGFLCRPRDASDLAEKMICIARHSPLRRDAMGAAGRAKMELEFDQRTVVSAYLQALGEALDKPRLKSDMCE